MLQWKSLASSAMLLLLFTGQAKNEVMLDDGQIWEKQRIKAHFMEKKQEKTETGKPITVFDWSKSPKQKGTIALEAKLWLPDFEEAEVVLECTVPADSSIQELKMGFVTRASIPHPGKDSRYFSVKAPVDSLQKGSRAEVVFPLDYEQIKKTDPTPHQMRINTISFAYDKTKGKKNTISFGKIFFRQKGIYSNLQTNTGLLIQDIAKKGKPSVFIANTTGMDKTVRVACSAKEIGGKTVFQKNEMRRIPSKGNLKLPLELPEKQGVYSIEWSVSHDGKTRILKKNIAKMKPTGRPGKLFSSGFLFSITDHPQHYSTAEQIRILDYAEACGLNHIRWGSECSWEHCQPRKEDPILIPKAMHEENQRVISRNIERQMLLQGYPRWARTASPDPNKKGKKVYNPDLNAWEKWCREVAGAFKGKVRHFEVWNEPFISGYTPEEYGPLQAAAYKGVKAGNPDAFVFAGGFGNSSSIHLQEKTLKLFPDTCDVIAFHVHGPFEIYINPVTGALRQWRRAGAKQPWFANETALSTKNDLLQAETLFKKLFYSWAKGSIGYTWYNLRGKGWNPKSGEHWFGLLYPDCSPRAGYVAYNAITGLYRDASFKTELKFQNDIFSYRLETEKYALFPLWNASLDKKEQLFLFSTNAEKAEFFDLFGNRTELTIRKGGKNNYLIVPIGTPGTVRLTPADSTFRFDAPFAFSEDRIILRGGSCRKVHYSVYNPSAAAWNISVSLEMPEKTSCSAGTVTKTAAAGKMELFEFNLCAEKDFSSADGQKTIKFRIKIPEPGISEQNTFLIQPAAIVSQETFQKHRPVFSLNRPDQVAKLITYTGSTAHLHWTGPRDCEAYVYIRPLKAGEQFLRFTVVVCDDIHFAEKEGHFLFTGDSLQLLLQLPGQKSLWEIGFARLNSGKNVRHIWFSPEGYDRDALLKRIKYSTSFDHRKVLFYTFSLPLKELGTSAESLRKSGFRMNLIVNDNDGEGRESLLSIIPASSTNAAKTMKNFPVVVFE